MPTLSLIDDITEEETELQQLYSTINDLPEVICWLIGTFIGFKRMVHQRWTPDLPFDMMMFHLYAKSSSELFTYDDYNQLAAEDEEIGPSTFRIGENWGERMFIPDSSTGVTIAGGVSSGGLGTVGYCRETGYFPQHVQECNDRQCCCVQWFLFRLSWVAPNEYTGSSYDYRWLASPYHVKIDPELELKLHTGGNGDLSYLTWQAARLAHFVGWGTFVSLMQRMHWMTQGRESSMFPRIRKITECFPQITIGDKQSRIRCPKRKRKRESYLHLACSEFGCDAGEDEQCYNCGHFSVEGAESHMAPCTLIADSLQDKQACEKYWDSYVAQYSSLNPPQLTDVVYNTWLVGFPLTSYFE